MVVSLGVDMNIEQLSGTIQNSNADLVDLIEKGERDAALAYTQNLLKNPAFAGMILHFVSVRLLQWMKEPPYDSLRLGLECTTIAPELRQEIFWQLLLKNAVRTGDMEVVKIVAEYVDPCWQFSSGLREAAEHQNSEMFVFLYHMSEGERVRTEMELDPGEVELEWWDEQVALMQREVLQQETLGTGASSVAKKL